MLPERLISLRKEKDKTQDDIAKYLGITRPAYTAYESGRRNPDYDMLKKLATLYNVTTDFLLGITDEKNLDEHEVAARKVQSAIADDPELLEFWNELTTRDDLVLMFKQTKDLSPQAIKRIIKYIKIVEDEEAQEDY